MSRKDLVARAKAILAEAYEEAAEMVALYLEKHPSEARQTLCKEIDPENWSALDARVRRAEARKPNADAVSRPTRAFSESSERHAKSVLTKARPEELREIIESLPPSARRELAEVAVAALPAFKGSKEAPLDISHLPKTGEAKLNRWLQEGKDMWQKHGEDLTEAQYQRFIDKLTTFVAKIASEELVKS